MQSRFASGCVLGFVLGLGAARAHAQMAQVSPTRGVLVPGAPIAGNGEATAVELNPGQIPFVQGTSTALVFNHWSSAIEQPGRGIGFMLGTPLVLLGQQLPLSLGLGLHWLNRTWLGEPESAFKTQVGAAFRLGRGLGLGVTWDRMLGERYGGLSSFTFGLGARLHNSVALGLAVRDALRPRVRDGFERIPRVWDVELALRPPRSHRFELGLGLAWDDRGTGASNVRPHLRLRGHVGRSTLVFADLHRAGLGSADTTPLVGTIGLAVSFDHTTLAGAAVGIGSGSPSGHGDAAAGGSFTISSTYVRQTGVVTSQVIAKVKLGGLDDDRVFVEVVLRLRRLVDDTRVAAVLLQIESLELGLGRIEELRALVAALRSKKPVYAYVTHPSTREYYLAAACEQIAIHPAGSLYVSGLAQTITFYKGGLDKLGVHVDLVRIAEWKGAMEPFIMTESSAPVRANRDAVLDDDFGRIVTAIARGRAGLDESKVKALIDEGGHGPGEARRKHLVDAIVDEEGIEAFAQGAFGRKLAVRDLDNTSFARSWWRPGRVAVIMIDGTIADGGGPSSPLPQASVAWVDGVVDALTEVRNDSSVRAVVLRVNSPGGTAFGSDRIAREIVRLRKAGKPVIASMGDVAASGGYYVSAPADDIFAEPSTLTGSIGIFSYKADVQGLMAKIGLSSETQKRGALADQFSLFRPWTDVEREQVRAKLQGMYDLFLDTVAQGRATAGVTRARADELGRGRIWTGAEAKGQGLVDKIGGLSDAIDEAARRSGVLVGQGGLPELVVLPKKPPSGLRAVLGVSAQIELDALAKLGTPAARLLVPMLLEGGTGIQARLPFDIEIR